MIRPQLTFIVTCGLALIAHTAQASILHWPVEFSKPWTQISSSFGPRLRASHNYEYEFHKGLDIVGTTTDTVVAAANGKVSAIYLESDSDSLYPNGGNVVVLRHTADPALHFQGQTFSTYYTLYLHLSSIDSGLTAGDSVNAGDVLGLIGNSGTTDFTHLHFEVRIGTVCSLASSCNTTRFDPHVHPLRYLQYPQRNHIHVSHKINQTNLRVNVRTRRNEPDVNKIMVTTFDQAGLKIKRRTVNFSTRQGTNSSNITLLPKRYSIRSTYYRLAVHFHDLITAQTAAVRVKVCDVHMHCTKQNFSN